MKKTFLCSKYAKTQIAANLTACGAECCDLFCLYIVDKAVSVCESVQKRLVVSQDIYHTSHSRYITSQEVCSQQPQ